MINLDKKIFKAISNSDTGEVNENTLFYYRQKDNIISANYVGGEIKKLNLSNKNAIMNLKIHKIKYCD